MNETFSLYSTFKLITKTTSLDLPLGWPGHT